MFLINAYSAICRHRSATYMRRTYPAMFKTEVYAGRPIRSGSSISLTAYITLRPLLLTCSGRNCDVMVSWDHRIPKAPKGFQSSRLHGNESYLKFHENRPEYAGFSLIIFLLTPETSFCIFFVTQTRRII